MTGPPFGQFEQPRPIRVRNDSGEAIPACAAMRITGLDDDDKALRIVGKPNADSQTDLIIFNGPTKINVPGTDDDEEESGHGIGYAGFPILALCYANDPAPVNGDQRGITNGQWELRAGKTGFVIEGNALTTTSVGHYAQVTTLGGTIGGTRVEVVEPHNSGVTPPFADWTDQRVLYLNLDTDNLDVGENCWVRDANA